MLTVTLLSPLNFLSARFCLWLGLGIGLRPRPGIVRPTGSENFSNLFHGVGYAL